MKVIRQYVKRATDKSLWDGDVGSVTFEAPEGDFKLNGKKLPIGSVEYLLNFALQAFQDAYAGATSLDEAKGNFDKKVTAVVEGTLGQRSGGGVDEFTTVARSIVKGLVKAKKGAEAVKSITEDELDKLFAKNEEVLRPKVEAEVAARKAERERKAKLAQSIDLEI